MEVGEGFVASPGFPNRVTNKTKCSWLLRQPDEQVIRLNFVTFNLGADCKDGIVIVYNGKTPMDPKIGEYCRDQKPSTITSQGSFLLVEYHGAPLDSGHGFNFTYEPVVGGKLKKSHVTSTYKLHTIYDFSEILLLANKNGKITFKQSFFSF